MLVSIVIPSFNQARYLDAALVSLQQQDYRDLEIIVVDGGSSDDSVAVIEKHADHISWWRSSPDRGQGHALNEGFAHAHGEILGWLCADDMLTPGGLDAVVKAFLSTDADVVTARTEVITRCGTRVPWERLRWCNGRDMLLTGCTWSQPATFWRRHLWRARGGLDESLRFAMDYDLWLRFWETPLRVSYLNEVVAFERRHVDQKTTAANYAELRTEKLAVRRRAAARQGYGAIGLLLRSLFYRRGIRLVRTTRAFRTPSSQGGLWHGEVLGFERHGGAVDYLRLIRRWAAAVCHSDADEQALLRNTWTSDT